MLDEDDPIVAGYDLQVSSPGIERPVQRAVDFQRFLGHRIKLRLVEGHPRRRYTGTLQAYQDDELTIVVDGQLHVVLLDTIERAHLVLTLEEYQALGGVKDQ
jgi:ribosome maturation factor RimP